MLIEGQILYSDLFLEVQAEKKIQGFQKHFTEDIFLYLLLLTFCNHIPIIRTKHFKNYISILAFVKLLKLAGCFTTPLQWLL